MKYRAYFNFYENGRIFADGFVDFEATNRDEAEDMAQKYAETEEAQAIEADKLMGYKPKEYACELVEIEEMED